MADENLNQEQVKDEAPEVKELSPIEQRAAEQGWVPKEEWSGDEDDWRPAKEFLDRGELFKKIDEQNRTLKDFKKVINDLKTHNARIAKVEYQKAIDSLKSQKKEALLEGDADAVVEIDEKMAHVREAVKEAERAPVEQPSTDLHPAFLSWKERNSWYDTNKAMRVYADQIGIELGNKGLSPSDLLTEVSKQVRAEFPERFQNPRREAPGAVEGSTNKGGKSKDSFTLTDDERRVMNRFVKSGALSEEDYIKQLKEAKQRGV